MSDDHFMCGSAKAFFKCSLHSSAKWFLGILQKTSYFRKKMAFSQILSVNNSKNSWPKRNLIFALKRETLREYADNITFLFGVSQFLANHKPSIFRKFWKTDNSLVQTTLAFEAGRHDKKISPYFNGKI